MKKKNYKNYQLKLKQDSRIVGTKQIQNFQNQYVSQEQLKKPSQDVQKQITQYTKNQINNIVLQKTQIGQVPVANQISQSNQSARGIQYIEYTPNNKGYSHNTGAKKRQIQMHQTQEDPLLYTEHKHKQIAPGPKQEPAQILQSPPRPLTEKDKQDWKIPPCVPGWRNVHGYTIPLEMRVAADGRNLVQPTVNEKFAKISDAFSIAEKQARKEINERINIKQNIQYQDFLDQEEKMRKKAEEARIEKITAQNQQLEEDDEQEKFNKDRYKDQQEERQKKEEKQMRDEIMYMREKEIKRDFKMQNIGTKKSKQVRDQERDISEKIALGQAQPTAITNLYDQRLYNQSAGINSGFGDEDEFNAFDKPLFADRTAASIYKNINNQQDLDDDDGGEDKQKSSVQTVLSKKPNRGFEGADKQKGSNYRTAPVQFEKVNDEFFGMESFVEDPKKKVKK